MTSLDLPSSSYPLDVLRLVAEPEARGLLRTADVSGAQLRAYPLLARYWVEQPYLRIPILLHAAAVSRFNDCPQVQWQRVGVAAAELANSGEVSKQGMQSRLVAAATHPLPIAHAQLSGVYQMLASRSAGLDWVSLFYTYRDWDTRSPVRRERARGRVLEDFALSITQEGVS